MRHPRRMFGEGHPYMCEYMEELVESRRRLETGGEKWVGRNAWIHLGMETMGMKAFVVPVRSIPSLPSPYSGVTPSHPQQ